MNSKDLLNKYADFNTALLTNQNTLTAYLACDSLTGVLPKRVAFMTCGNL